MHKIRLAIRFHNFFYVSLESTFYAGERLPFASDVDTSHTHIGTV